MFLLNSSPSTSVVVVVGLGVVFLGLILIILACKIMSAIVAPSQKKEQEPIATNNTVTSEAIENKGEVTAAIAAAVAENLGKDVSAIRIHSIKKI